MSDIEHSAVTPGERGHHADAHAGVHYIPDEPHRPRYGQPFWPGAIFGSSIYILATVIALIVLAIIHPAELQHPADPLNHEQVNPRPEWYFLFLFQVLKLFGGPLELIGTAVIPGILTVLLIGLPFYDRNWSRRAIKRPVAITSMSVALILLIVLTYIPLNVGQPAGTISTTVVAQPKFSNVEAIFAQNCTPCHIGGATAGLNLANYQGVMKGGSTSAGGVVNGAVVKPGDPNGSYLYQVVVGKQKAGARMPANGKVLSTVDAQNIYNWIKTGAKGT